MFRWIIKLDKKNATSVFSDEETGRDDHVDFPRLFPCKGARLGKEPRSSNSKSCALGSGVGGLQLRALCVERLAFLQIHLWERMLEGGPKARQGDESELL